MKRGKFPGKKPFDDFRQGSLAFPTEAQFQLALDLTKKRWCDPSKSFSKKKPIKGSSNPPKPDLRTIKGVMETRQLLENSSRFPVKRFKGWFCQLTDDGANIAFWAKNKVVQVLPIHRMGAHALFKFVSGVGKIQQEHFYEVKPDGKIKLWLPKRIKRIPFSHNAWDALMKRHYNRLGLMDGKKSQGWMYKVFKEQVHFVRRTKTGIEVRSEKIIELNGEMRISGPQERAFVVKGDQIFPFAVQ